MPDVLGLLSISRKAGKAEIGELPVLTAVGNRKARLVLIASDASENTVFRISSAVGRTHIVSVRTPYTKEELGAAFGRASCAVCAVCDVGLSVSAITALAARVPDKYELEVRAIREMANRIQQRKLKKPGPGAGRKEKNRTD